MPDDLRAAMSNKAIKTKAEELLGFGLSKQQVFDNLMLEFPEARPKKVAEVLRYMPSQRAREHYRTLHFVLLGAIAASAVLRIARPVLQDGIRMDQATAYLSLVPIATLLLGWSILRWQGQVFGWVGWGNIVGAFSLLDEFSHWVKDGADHWAFATKLLSVTIGAMALYLAYRVFTKPNVEKDPMTGVERVLFREEGLV